MTISRNADLSSLLPLSASAFHILLALAEGERHGYSISKEVEISTEGTVRLGPGTLYRLLKQMVIDGWIAEIQSDEEDDTRRRRYGLTAWGRRVAEAEAARLEALVRIARSRHLLPSMSFA